MTAKEVSLIRTVQTYTHNQWVDIEFKNLKHGDRFRLFDNGERVVNSKGHSEWIACGEPYFKDDNWTIDILLG